MRALAAVLAAVAWSCSLAHDIPHTPRGLLSILGASEAPVGHLLSCAEALGPTKCLSAFSAWRAENAVEALSKQPRSRFNLTADMEQFPWEKYRGRSNEELFTELCDDTGKLLQHRSLRFTWLPGYTLALQSKGSGKLNVDVIKNEDQSAEEARGTVKKLKKRFYEIVPIILIPGLIMSAVLPFILPALKMMTIGVVMLNNMALTGAVFTLLRNNAFSDKYEKKVVYVNDGYKNEKHTDLYFDEHQFENGNINPQYGNLNADYSNIHPQYMPDLGQDYELVESPYFGNQYEEVPMNMVQHQQHLKRTSTPEETAHIPAREGPVVNKP